MNDDVDNGQVVIHQHKVPRKYLSAWCCDAGALHTLRCDGKEFSCGAEGVEAENSYYHFVDLTKEELRFLFRFVTQGNFLGMPVKEVQLRMDTLVGTALLNGIVAGMRSDRSEFDAYMKEASSLNVFSSEFMQTVWAVWSFNHLGLPLREAYKQQLDRVVMNGGESLLCEIENAAWHALDLAVIGRVQEINSNKDLKESLARYMVYQMMRGDVLPKTFGEDGHTLSKESLVRVASYVRYFLADALWVGLARRLDSMNFWLIENSTTEEFITGDNPVFNLDRSMPPSEFTLYFPVSPSRAVLLVSQSVESKYTRFLRPSIDDVKELNCRLCDACISQIHASRKDTFSRNAYRPRWVCPKPSR